MEENFYDENKYIILKDYREGYNKEMIQEKFSDYFVNYDYVLGDLAYGKLRLKGFYKESNKNCKEINNYKNIENYLLNHCAYDCRYFIIEKK
ncbi:MAG: DUF1027 domain-containing protein [Bacilli bacterium]|nr:DUF1027 domain-containing protein [Bacilli bacterium]